MSKPVSRLGDICSGHGCFPPRPIITASSDVYINGQQTARVGDALAPHCCKGSCHPGVITSGSSTVYVNGQPVARITSGVNCGSMIAQGSGNVFVG